MKVGRFSKRVLGGAMICAALAAPTVAPVATHAASRAMTRGSGIPKQCVYIEQEINNLNPTDFPNLQAFQNVLRSLLTQLQACEAHYRS
jgi:hypothetical protein